MEHLNCACIYCACARAGSSSVTSLALAETRLTVYYPAPVLVAAAKWRKSPQWAVPLCESCPGRNKVDSLLPGSNRSWKHSRSIKGYRKPSRGIHQEILRKFSELQRNYMGDELSPLLYEFPRAETRLTVYRTIAIIRKPWLSPADSAPQKMIN